MPDEAPAVEQDQLETEAPENQDQPQEESFTDFDPTQVPEDANREWFAERVKNWQSDYTRKTQELAEERKEAEQAQEILQALEDPELAPGILSAIGFQLQDDAQEDQGYVDPEEQLQQQVAALEQQLAQDREERQTASQAEAEDELIADQIEALPDIEELDKGEISALANYARIHRDQRGNPDVKAAYEVLNGYAEKRHQAWKEARKTSRPPAQGRSGLKRVDPKDPEAMRQAMIEAAEGAMASD